MSQLNATTLTGMPSIEELEMMRDYIMFPHLITMVQKSIDDISYKQITLKNVLLRCQEYIMQAISADFRGTKQEMRRRGIKVVEEEANDGILYFRYFCRGYEERFGIVREALRTEIISKLTSYTNNLGQQLKSNKG
ncbi:hypothetical protein B1748_36090 [Paenibacillus sp. MY03]|uniref:hypothetical protein n=1 Tax=Paenibacillus sp. MY03 TaxID=302980 RepID=UPI000B3C6B25|nr:hypothetical protein [Paenibacillus sp. MY03]OUS67619.1 hypothetical protein B1748_36090 [Paenibacillus sp. MY03]